MRIYNYLFYKTYILAKHSRNFDDTPVYGGIIFYRSLCECLLLLAGLYKNQDWIFAI